MRTSTYLNPRILTRLFCAVMVAIVSLPVELEAANNNKNKNRKPTTKKGAASELPTISSVKKNSMTFNGKTYFFADNIKVIINGKEATTSQLKRGMQASVSGKVLTFGKAGKSNTYEASRIVARRDNKLAAKAKAANKKAAEAAKKRNQKNKKRNNKKRR